MSRQVANKASSNGLRVTLLCVLFLMVGAMSQVSHLNITTARAQQQRGKASYYSKRATGVRTASGERLHHDSMTCAHRTFPFGTILKVTNLSNGKQVVVRVTDRGPFGRGRIIDLSWGAAKALDMLAQGITTVTVERMLTTNYPMKTEDMSPELPIFEFEIADISPYGIVPRWQDMNSDMKRIKNKRITIKNY